METVSALVSNIRSDVHSFYMKMICKRCQRALRTAEGLKCGICESCLQVRSMSEIGDQPDQPEPHNILDKGYQWKCSLCKNYIKSVPSNASEPGKDREAKHNSLMQAVTAISEKFELVNKIQLPKLNSDLVHIKTVADHIAEQTETIFKKIIEVEEKRQEDKEVFTSMIAASSTCRYRKRNIKLSPKVQTVTSKNMEAPVVPITDKSMRYRSRRRSHLLRRIFKLLNKKTDKSPKIDSEK